MSDARQELNSASRTNSGPQEIERLKAGIWKMVGILGFDQDGAEHHHLTHPDIVEYGVRAATEFRKDYEDLLDELPVNHLQRGRSA